MGATGSATAGVTPAAVAAVPSDAAAVPLRNPRRLNPLALSSAMVFPLLSPEQITEP
jgi:hypothetical protein